MTQPKHSEKFYNTKLQRYFDKYYSPYAETAEFYVNPEINKWRFNIYGTRRIFRNEKSV